MENKEMSNIMNTLFKDEIKGQEEVNDMKVKEHLEFIRNNDKEFMAFVKRCSFNCEQANIMFDNEKKTHKENERLNIKIKELETENKNLIKEKEKILENSVDIKKLKEFMRNYK